MQQYYTVYRRCLLSIFKILMLFGKGEYCFSNRFQKSKVKKVFDYFFQGMNVSDWDGSYAHSGQPAYSIFITLFIFQVVYVSFYLSLSRFLSLSSSLYVVFFLQFLLTILASTLPIPAGLCCFGFY